VSASGLDARYGRTPERRRRGRVLAVAAIVVGAVLLAAWAVWTGLLSPQASLEANAGGDRILSDHEVELRLEVTATPGNAVVCALAAQSEKHAVVGWKVVRLEPSEEYHRVVVERFLTSEPAVVALIDECRLA